MQPLEQNRGQTQSLERAKSSGWAGTLQKQQEHPENDLLHSVLKAMACLSGSADDIQKTKIMASGLITSWHIDMETVETVADFILGAPKSRQIVTAAMKLKDTCSLEGKL